MGMGHVSSRTQKKIVYVIGSLTLGGAERYLVETAIRLHQERFTPKVYCLFGSGPLKCTLDRHHIAVTVFHARHDDTGFIPCWRSRAFFALYRYLRYERPDIVHCYMYKPSIYGGIAAKLAGVPHIITQRTNLGYFKEGHRWYQRIENLVNQFTDRVITDSEAAKQAVLQQESIAAQKIVVIHSGVNLSQYRPLGNTTAYVGEQSLVKRRYGIPKNSPVVGIIANLRHVKGHHEFFLAASSVHQKFPDVRFVCVGKDLGIQAELQKLIHTLGFESYVLFTGQVHNVAKILCMLDILVVASHTEASCLVVLEGMAAGKPIVATTVGGIPEAIIHGKSGLLVPPKDPDALARAITHLLHDPAYARYLGQNAQARAETSFSIEKTVEKLESVYESFG